MLKFPSTSKNYGDDYYRMFSAHTKNITFIVTHDCNFACNYCYEHHKSNKKMSLEIGKSAIDFLFAEDAKQSRFINAFDAHGLIFDFIGGEPLLEIRLIDQIMDYFLYKALDMNHRWANNFRISMSSNGSLYFTKDVQAFLKKWGSRVNIGITIDGNKELHDACRIDKRGNPTYNRVAPAFADAKERFHQYGTKMTISQENLPYLFNACRDMISDFDLSSLWGNPIFEAEWSNSDAAMYYQELKKLADWMIDTERWKVTWISFFADFIGHAIPETENQNYCGGNGKMLAIDTDGTIYPCVRFAPISIGCDKSNHCVIGHVNSGLQSNDQEKKFLDNLTLITRRSQSTDKCWSCPIASGCATCTAWQFEKYGDGNHRCTNICQMHKARVMATSYFYNTIYRQEGESKRFAFNLPAEWAIPIVGEKEYQMLLSLAAE